MSKVALAKLVDENTGQVIVAIGSNNKMYRKMGFTEMSVEEAWNGSWYLEGMAPEKPQDVINAELIAKYQKFLDETDWYVVRNAETGVPIPDDISAQRQHAREEINRLRDL